MMLRNNVDKRKEGEIMPKKIAYARNVKKPRPALTPEARENQLISEAMDLVEERILNGTATSQETTHFLKLGSEKEKLELEKLRKENELLIAKTEQIQSAKKVQELYAEAIAAFTSYQPSQDIDEPEPFIQ